MNVYRQTPPLNELRFLRNDRPETGTQSFTVIATISLASFPDGLYLFATWGDYDNDGDLDVFLGALN